jgi:hypothetical protein
MDEEFVKKILDQASNGLVDMHDINEIWRVYKDHTKGTHPDVYALIEKDEYMVKKIFLSSIDIFLAVPQFLMHIGIDKVRAATTMFNLDRSMRQEYRKVLEAEGKL